MQVNKLQYRQAMSSLGAAVNVVTSEGPMGSSSRAGCTVSAVCSVTDEPPTVMVCINRDSRNAAAFRDSGALCVNVVSADQQGLAQLFSDRDVPVDARFAAARWSRLATGAPVLDDALASLDCEIRSVTTVGTHDMFLCEVKALRMADSGDALIYFGRHFHRLAAPVSSVP
ncbi:flavin reductase [Roseateles toxinivorans]|uniref:Flavin reductase n=1 Tax=Roseateles toxinivorans TaxID=270368 RepID=A0A4R6QBX1_9BURK|nr:flavin reductase [Roseateles toxinivorans]TDP59740.1 flavin reductase [Roseateles toxinivorans]